MEGKSDILGVLHQNRIYFMRENSINLVATRAGRYIPDENELHDTSGLESFTV